MLIIVYLNKPYIFHYYKSSRLYSTKHNHTPLYNPIHHHPTPCTPTPHQIPLNIHPFMTHPLRVAENCPTDPLHKAQNLMTPPLSAPAYPPPPYTFWPVPNFKQIEIHVVLNCFFGSIFGVNLFYWSWEHNLYFSIE